MTDRFRAIADHLYEFVQNERNRTAYDWLISRGWDGKDFEKAKKLAEGYVLVQYPDFTWEVRKIPENATEAAQQNAAYCLRCLHHNYCDKTHCPYNSENPCKTSEPC